MPLLTRRFAPPWLSFPSLPFSGLFRTLYYDVDLFLFYVLCETDEVSVLGSWWGGRAPCLFHLLSSCVP